MSRSRRKRATRVEKLLLFAGLVCVNIWIWSMVRTAVSQDWASWAFDQKLHGQPATVSEYVKFRLGIREAAKPPAAAKVTPPAPAPPQPPAIKTGDLIGRLEIPRLKLQAVVREGTGARTLDLALGHIPGTALPGQSGNVGVAGHRDSLFRGLGQIRKSDRIEFQTLNGTYEYDVESTRIVSPQTVSVLDASLQPEITLVTCYPFHYVGSAPDRFIVKARLVSQNASQNALQNPGQPQLIAENQPHPARPVAAQPARRAHEPENRRPLPSLRKPSGRRVFFQVSEGHSTTLVPGISLGLEWADATSQRVNGWMWVMPDRRTIWLSRQHPREPLVFYGHEDGKRRELVITTIGRNSMKGYLQL
jgi:sortase A